MFEQFVKKQEQEVDEAEQDIYKENGISQEIMEMLMKKFKDDPVIKDKMEKLQ